ncbi:hypothetical protein FHS14_006325 [Paenibacillus baekrokdamisoli]|nr:hypothetical protein [Paenibacillus baekrokdamisoli]MBB3073288.1 hypothetical protein [Paenibacillus baekrokdamisoli]
MTKSNLWIEDLEIRTNKYSTAAGIKVGDSVEDLLKAYPNIHYSEATVFD